MSPPRQLPSLLRASNRFNARNNSIASFLNAQKRSYSAARNLVFQVSEEVQDALTTGKPVVALETTIYTHGTPLSLDGLVSTNIHRLPISRKRRPCFESGIRRPSQRRCPCNNWYPQWSCESRLLC
jgi:hypothetical protein